MKRICLLFVLILYLNKLLIDAFDLMRSRNNIENLISKSLTGILNRSSTLERNDQIAITQEFKDLINGLTNEEEIWVVNNPIK